MEAIATNLPFSFNINFFVLFIMHPASFLLFLAVALSSDVFAQYDFPRDIPLKGKVLSYEIVRVYGDSLNPKETLVERVINDKRGRVLQLTEGSMSDRGEPSSVKKHVYTSGKEVIYECSCRDIESFLKEFLIHDRKELYNQPQYYTDQEPTHWVTINKLDKKGNVIHSAHYSRNGYRTTDVWFEYTTNGNVRTETVYDMDSVMTSAEKYKHDARGNVIERTIKRNDTPEIKEIMVYDSSNNLLEKRYFEQNMLTIHSEYAVKVSGNKKEFTTINRLRDTTFVEKIVTYDERNREIEQIVLGYWRKNPLRTRWEYYDNGDVKSIARYNEEGNLQTKTEYVYDSRHNWIVARVSGRVTVHEKETKRDELRVTKYIQKITYN